MNLHQVTPEMVGKWHKDAQDESASELLKGVPESGGHVSRMILDKLIRAAFIDGACAQIVRPLPDVINLNAN